MMKKINSWRLLFILSVCSLSAWGEGLVNDTLNGARADENGVVYDDNNNVSGREYKSGSAASSGGAGNAAAIATGTSLIASGTAMIAFLPTVAPGTALIGMGIMELMQAAVDRGSQGNNQGQYDLLTGNSLGHFQPGAETGLTESQKNDILAQAINPQVQKFLAAQGIDAFDFGRDVLEGRYTGPEDLDKYGFGTDQVRAAKKALGEVVEESFVTPEGLETNVELANGTPFSNQSNFSLGKKSSDINLGDLKLETSKKGDEKSGERGRGKLGSSGLLSSSSEEGFYDSVSGGGGMGRGLSSRDSGLSPAMEYSLINQGISPRRKGMTIFTAAKIQFQNFGKWRGKRRQK